MDIVDKLTTELDSIRQQFQELLSASTGTEGWQSRFAEIKEQANATVAALWEAGYCRRVHNLESALKTAHGPPLMFDMFAGFATIHQNSQSHTATAWRFMPGLLKQPPIAIEPTLVGNIDEIYRRYGMQLVERMIYACEKITASVELERSSILQVGVNKTADTNSPGRKRPRWTQQEKDIRKLKDARMHTKAILDALRPKYPDLTWEVVRSICNRNSTSNRKRRRR